MAFRKIGIGRGDNLPPPPAPPLAARSYRNFYSRVTSNPAFDRTAVYLHGYHHMAEPGLQVLAPTELRDQTVTVSDRRSMAFLCLVPKIGDVTHEVTVVHSMVQYMDVPGDDETAYHNRVLGLLGEVQPFQLMVVEEPNAAFHLVTAPARVPTSAAMAAILPMWENPAVVLGPYGADTANTKLIRTRHNQLTPGRYATILINHWVNAKTAYEEVGGAIAADHQQEACQDVLTWLRAACTARGGAGDQT